MQTYGSNNIVYPPILKYYNFRISAPIFTENTLIVKCNKHDLQFYIIDGSQLCIVFILVGTLSDWNTFPPRRVDLLSMRVSLLFLAVMLSFVFPGSCLTHPSTANSAHVLCLNPSRLPNSGIYYRHLGLGQILYCWLLHWHFEIQSTFSYQAHFGWSRVGLHTMDWCTFQKRAVKHNAYCRSTTRQR